MCPGCVLEEAGEGGRWLGGREGAVREGLEGALPGGDRRGRGRREPGAVARVGGAVGLSQESYGMHISTLSTRPRLGSAREL